MNALMRRLNALPERLLRRARRAAAESAEHAAEMARELAPVDTGELRGSISHSVCEEGAATIAAAPHAAAVEFGAAGRSPQPFLLPAARAVAAEFFRSAGKDEE